MVINCLKATGVGVQLKGLQYVRRNGDRRVQLLHIGREQVRVELEGQSVGRDRVRGCDCMRMHCQRRRHELEGFGALDQQVEVVRRIEVHAAPALPALASPQPKTHIGQVSPESLHKGNIWSDVLLQAVKRGAVFPLSEVALLDIQVGSRVRAQQERGEGYFTASRSGTVPKQQAIRVVPRSGGLDEHHFLRPDLNVKDLLLHLQ